MDGRSVTNPSLLAAMQRAHCSQAPDPVTCQHVATDIENSLEASEFVLECANTTHPGFHSLLAVTNQRMFIGTGPGQLDVIDITSLTRWRIIEQPALVLELHIFHNTYTIHGLGSKGIARIIHALQAVLKAAAESPPTMTSTMVDMLSNAWQNMQNGNQH